MSYVKAENTRRISETGKPNSFYSQQKHRSLEPDKLLLLQNNQKRNTHLPSLGKDPTSNTDHGKSTLYRSLDEYSNGMDKTRGRIDMNMKIISHLRRHVNKRTQRKLNKAALTKMVSDEMEAPNWGHLAVKELHIHEPDVNTIFTSYSETGEKFQDGDNRKRLKENISKLPKPRSTITSSRINNAYDSPMSTHLPVIKHKNMPNDVGGREKSCTGTTSAGLSMPVENSQKILITELSNTVVSSTCMSLPALTTKKEALQGKISHERIQPEVTDALTSDLPDSPLIRSDVEEKDKLSSSEIINQILNGDVHSKYPVDKSVVYLYIASGNTDMEAELSFMQEHLYSQLRSHFKQNGQELRILDLHWGFRDTTSDDHTTPDIIRRAISKAQHSNLGVNFVILLGQKYGPNILPSTIPKNEYESILNAASIYRKAQKSVLRAAMIELQALEVEQEKSVENALSENGTKQCNENSLEKTAAKKEDKKGNTTDKKETREKEHNQQAATPSTRDSQALKTLREAEDQLPDVKAFRQWYVLDDNAVPAVYRLQKISTVYRDISRSEPAKRQAAKLSFTSVETKLLKILNTFPPDAVKFQDVKQTKICSMLEKELDQIFENPITADHTLCVVRNIDQLSENLDEPAVGDYIDLVSKNDQAVEADTWVKMKNIRKEIMNGQVPERNVSSFLVEWANGGIRPASSRAHYAYMERMCKLLFDQIVGHVDVKDSDKRPPSWSRDLFSEVSEHVRQCHELARSFQGREDILTLMESYLKSETRRPLVVYGKSGCGKSSILGKSASEIKHWFEGTNVTPRVIVRFIGCTAHSTNIRSMLKDVTLQLCYMYGNDPTKVPTNYKGIFNDLATRLEQATEDKPLVIILDGVDGLSDDYDGRRLMWLPLELPPNVYLIISTNSEDKMQCLPAARNLFRGHDSSFMEIGQLGPQEALLIFQDLIAKRRRLTEKQLTTVTEAVKISSSPLFVKMTIAEAIKWTSYLAPDATRLGETVTKIVTLRLGRLEMDHGEPLTRRALGYISAAKHGLANNELEDVLSLDDAVMDDVMTSYKLPKRRLPGLLWIRLFEDLEDLLKICWVENVRTFTWANSQISEVIDERYLNQRDKAPSYHKALAEYFSGVNTAKSKLQSNSDKWSERFVTSQELYQEPENSPGNGSNRVYNHRALNELPYHLLKCQMISQLKLSCLCNYEWMLARLCGTSLESLLEEYQSGLLVEPADTEMKIMMDVLLLSMDALQRDSRQLATQLVGRLHRIVAADDPKAPGDPKKYPSFHTLLSAAKQSSLQVLIPSVDCLIQPGDLIYGLLSGHTDAITALTLTTDGLRALTVSVDRTIKVWDIRTGKVIKSINGVSSNVSDIKTAKRNTLAITVEGSHINIWDIDASRCVFTISQYVDPANIAIADEDKILVAVYDGSNIFRSWNFDNLSLLCEAHIPDKSVHRDNSILITAASSGQNVLLAFRSSNSAAVHNVRSGKMVRKLQCHEKNSSILALATSSEYFIICCRQQHVALHEINALELFDALKGVYIRTVLGCAQDNITHITLNLSGSHAIGISTNSRTNISDVAVFNLETEEHKHLIPHCGVSTMCACLDFRYCLIGARGDNSLKIWNLSSKIIQPASKVKKQLGLSDIWPMIDNPRYVLAKAINNGPISVWNVTKGKCLQSAVRIERGLTEGYDALIVRNTRLVILTDRGLSNVSVEPLLVFQTVLVYDLKLKKYIRKLQGCYIVPAASHEYSLLDNDSLLGPSENRSHFIIWNLITGHAVTRIKTAFKELEKRLENSAQLIDGASIKKDAPWEKRVSSKRSVRSSKQDKKAEVNMRRLELLREEKDNVVDQFLVSDNQKVLVASFYSHYLCVFDIESLSHTHTLLTEYSMMLLHTAAMTYDGGYLVIANYDEISKNSYVTLWDCTKGEIKRRLRKEKDVIALAITDDAHRVVIGRASNELHIWDPMKSNSLRRIRGYDGFRFEITSKIFLVENGEKAIVFAGDISMWDLTTRTLLAVFTPDTRISVCKVILNGRLIIFGMYDKPELVVLKLTSGKMKMLEDTDGVELFGETTGDTPDEDEEDDEDNDN